MRPMFEIHDQQVTRSAAWWLVDQLRIIGRADEVTAAAAIEHALTEDDPGVLLSERERDAVLAVLDDPPQSLLRLRIALAKDRRKRAA